MPCGEMHYDVLAKTAAMTLFSYSSRIAEIFAYSAGAFFLALYMMIDRNRLRGGLYAVVPRSHHIRLSHILWNMETIVGGYILGQMITSALMTAFVFVLLTAFRVPNALAIAVFAGLADVLPYIGVFLSMGPTVLATLTQGPAVTIIVLVLMLAYEEFESRVLVPRIYGRAMRLPSSVILFSLLAGAALMGVMGAFLALPVAATIRMLIEEFGGGLPGEPEQIQGMKLRRKDDLSVGGVPAAHGRSAGRRGRGHRCRNFAGPPEGNELSGKGRGTVHRGREKRMISAEVLQIRHIPKPLRFAVILSEKNHLPSLFSCVIITNCC